MAAFDPQTLAALGRLNEVAIRTGLHPKSAVVIWIVVADGAVFVRSVKGAKGRWYRDLAGGGQATLEFDGRTVPVAAFPVRDAATVERASREYLTKYRSSPYAEPMVRDEVLPTTLRLEPR